MAQKSKHFKEEETKKLCQWIEEQQLWYRTLDLTQFISAGAEQKVYLKGEKGVIKLNDSIYYSSWLDYFYNLLLNNYFFPDTAYQLLGFYKEDKTLYAVVQQDFIKADTPTSIEEVRTFMKNSWRCFGFYWYCLLFREWFLGWLVPSFISSQQSESDN